MRLIVLAPALLAVGTAVLRGGMFNLRIVIAALVVALAGTAAVQTPPLACTNASGEFSCTVASMPSQIAVAAATATVVAVMPAGCAHFKGNPICKPLPSTPAISRHSSSWAALEFQSGRASIATQPVVGGDFPIDIVAGATVPQIIVCDVAPWSAGQCNGSHTNGITLDVPAKMKPSPNSDHHYSFIDYARQGEYDFWLASTPKSPGSTMHVGGLGFCPWSGNGTNCSGSTATNLASSLGLGQPAELVAAEATSSGTLGHAIAAATLCADPSWVAPATYSDGTNTNEYTACAGHTGSGDRPPEGTRWFLNYSDEQINAMDFKPYEAALLRTLDKEHYGGIITDTTWSGGQGLNIQWAYGDYSPASGGVDLSFPLGSIVLSRDIVFCSSGTC